MFTFIKEALTELEHVVWPTPNETKKYMMYTISVIIVVGIFLSILWSGFRFSLKEIRNQFPHEDIQTTVSGEDVATQEDLDNLLEAVEKRKAASGTTTETTVSPTDSGSTQVGSGN